ncbi:MAG: lytic murein transglycosylase B [Pseudomonadales bacterium]
MKLFTITAVGCLFFAGSSAGLADDRRLDLSRPEVQLFINEIVNEEGLSRAQVEASLEQARFQPSIIKAISRPAERVLTWKEYQDIFLTDRRVSEGVAFLAQHESLFADIEREYGVDRWVILSILGVETFYGRITGSYRVIDALTTLAFDYPPRSKFFRGQLKALFRLAQEQKQDVISLKGSYAGAMGYGQFIPTSYEAYAIDADQNGFADIWSTPHDIIASVANYFAEHRWTPGLTPLFALEAPDASLEPLFDNALKPKRTAASIREMGVPLPSEIGADEKVTLLRYAGKTGDEYWVGTQNFYTITRYNHSRLYAMAVFQLSEQLREAASVSR